MRLIDADALEDRCNNCLWDDDEYEHITAFIAEAPTIETRLVKQGSWDTHNIVKILCSGETLDGFCQCGNCGDVFPYQFTQYPYCPSCGARMSKEADTHRNT